MDLPLKLQLPYLLKNIDDFRVVRFQDNKLQEPGPHWYVAIPVSKTGFFLITIITSKGEKRAAYYNSKNQPKAVQCLVGINNDDFSFLNRGSVIDCNKTEYLDIGEIIHKVDETTGFKIQEEKIPAYLKKEIVSAIVKSPIVPRFIGDMAKAANPL